MFEQGRSVCLVKEGNNTIRCRGVHNDPWTRGLFQSLPWREWSTLGFSLLYLRWRVSSSEPHCRQFSVELPVRDDEKAGGAQPGRLLLDLPHQVGIQHCRPSDQKWYDMSYLSVECLNLISFKANLWVLGIGWLAALTSRKDGERRRRSVARDIFCLLLNHITCTMYMHFSTEGFS